MTPIFVEGGSHDGTWEEIQAQLAHCPAGESICALKQEGRCKKEAVLIGFEQAHKDLLVILDGDLSMPPEKLNCFYEAYVQGYGDLINSSRLVYPMETEAMRFLNRLANVFFAKLLS